MKHLKSDWKESQVTKKRVGTVYSTINVVSIKSKDCSTKSRNCKRNVRNYFKDKQTILSGRHVLP